MTERNSRIVCWMLLSGIRKSLSSFTLQRTERLTAIITNTVRWHLHTASITSVARKIHDLRTMPSSSQNSHLHTKYRSMRAARGAVFMELKDGEKTVDVIPANLDISNFGEN